MIVKKDYFLSSKYLIAPATGRLIIYPVNRPMRKTLSTLPFPLDGSI